MKQHWKRFIAACTVGNVLELYQFIIYGYFANIIGDLFFPTHNKYIALVETFAVFATGSLVRPFSAIIFGFVGDRMGRRISLILSIGIMALSTFSIGILPTYLQIGFWAPLLLIICRICQGLSMTGEEVGAAIFLLETAPRTQKGYASSWVLGSVYLGLVFGSIVTAITFASVNIEAIHNWAWRIPFLLGGLIGLIALFFRIKQPESYEFKKAITDNLILSNPLIKLFKENLFALLKTTLLFCLLGVSVYIFAVYIPNTVYISNINKFQTMLISAVGFLITFFISIRVGALVDRVGTEIPMIISSIGFILFSYPIFLLLNDHSMLAIVAGHLLFSVFLGLTAGSVMLEATESFPVNVRFSGCCVAFNLAMSIFGGTAPLLALYLSNITNNETAPALLLMFAAGVSLGAIFINKTTKEICYAN